MYQPRVENATPATPTKLQSMLRSRASRYSDWGDESLIGLLESKAIELGIANNVQKLVPFLEANVDINYQTLAQPVRIAFDEASRQHEDYDFFSTGFLRRVLEKTRSLDWDTQNPTDLADIMAWLIENESVPLSSQGQHKVQQQADAKEAKEASDHIQRVIFNITKGKPQFPRWSPQHGEVVNVDSAMLYQLTPDELKAMDEEVAALRRQRFDMDKDQQRELLHEVANQNRTGYIDSRFTADHKPQKIVGFNDRPNSLDLDRSLPRYREDADSSPIKTRVDVRSYAGNAIGVNGGKVSSDPFISPSTQREYTRAEVIALAKNDLATFRKLTKLDSSRINRILATK